MSNVTISPKKQRLMLYGRRTSARLYPPIPMATAKALPTTGSAMGRPAAEEEHVLHSPAHDLVDVVGCDELLPQVCMKRGIFGRRLRERAKRNSNNNGLRLPELPCFCLKAPILIKLSSTPGGNNTEVTALDTLRRERKGTRHAYITIYARNSPAGYNTRLL